MMDTLDKFFLKEFFTFFAIILIGLVALYLGIDLLSKVWGMDLPVGKIFVIYAYRIPKTMQLFVPVACLLATLIVLTNMSRQNEVLALYSSGIGTFRIVSTFIAIAATISTFSFLSFDNLVPTFSKREMLVKRGLDPYQDQLPVNPKAGFWYRSGKSIYNIGRFNPGSNLLEDLRVYDTSSDFHLDRMIHVKRARYDGAQWLLEDGYEVIYPPGSSFPSYRQFATISGIIPEKPGDFKTLQIEEETMKLRDLRRFIERNRGYGLDTTAQLVNYHERLAMVFTPLIFVLLAIPFATKPLKTHSIAKSVGFCFLVVFIYLLMSKLVVSIGKGGHIPPIMAAWFTNVFFLIFAGFLITKR